MHLALELGCTVSELRERLTEKEFVLWQRFASRYSLPTRRIELHLAQISLIVAKTMGNAKHVTLKDFLFEPPEEIEDTPAEVGMAMMNAITSKKVYRLGQGRKLKEVS